MTSQDINANIIAQKICVELYSPELRGQYKRYISSLFQAETIVYVLQALASGMTAIFCGLLTNYLYDKAKKSHRDSKRVKELEELISKQEEKIQELEDLVKHDYPDYKEAIISLSFHKDVVVKIKQKSPEIESIIQEKIEEFQKVKHKNT